MIVSHAIPSVNQLDFCHYASTIRRAGLVIEGNHTPRFWNIVRAQTPTMEKAKEWPKVNGQILEEDI